MSSPLDKKDIQLLQLLQKDARLTNRQLGEITGISASAVYKRVQRFENEGYINQYIAVINYKLIEKTIDAYIQVNLDEHDAELIAQFENDVIQISAVKECYRMAGKYDYLLKIMVKDMDEYRTLVTTKLLARVNTSFIIEEKKKTSVLLPGKNT